MTGCRITKQLLAILCTQKKKQQQQHRPIKDEKCAEKRKVQWQRMQVVSGYCLYKNRCKRCENQVKGIQVTNTRMQQHSGSDKNNSYSLLLWGSVFSSTPTLLPGSPSAFSPPVLEPDLDLTLAEQQTLCQPRPLGCGQVLRSTESLF